MSRVLTLVPVMFLAVLNWRTLAVLLLAFGALIVHDGYGLGWAIWLGLPLAYALGGTIGSEARMMGQQRLTRLLPASRQTLAGATGLALLMASLPGWLLATNTTEPAAVLVLVPAAALLGFAAGALLGFNGLIWITVLVTLMQFLVRDGIAYLMTVPVLDPALLAIAGLSLLLAWIGWKRVCRRPGRTRSDETWRVRAWLRDRPGQPLGWRLVGAYMLFGSVIALLALSVRPDGLSPAAPSPELMTDLSATLVFIGAILIVVTCAHELLGFRSQMRMMWLRPGYSRQKLLACATAGAGRALVVIGLLPLLLVTVYGRLALPEFPGVPWPALLTSLLMLTAMAALALRLAASTSHATAVLGTVILTLAVVMLGPAAIALWQPGGPPAWWPAASLFWAGLAVAAGAWARSAWLRLSLERIDHWPLVKLARESSFG